MTDHARAKEVIKNHEKRMRGALSSAMDEELSTIIGYVRALEGERDNAQAQVATLAKALRWAGGAAEYGCSGEKWGFWQEKCAPALSDTSQAAADHDRRVQVEALESAKRECDILASAAAHEVGGAGLLSEGKIRAANQIHKRICRLIEDATAIRALADKEGEG